MMTIEEANQLKLICLVLLLEVVSLSQLWALIMGSHSKVVSLSIPLLAFFFFFLIVSA